MYDYHVTDESPEMSWKWLWHACGRRFLSWVLFLFLSFGVSAQTIPTNNPAKLAETAYREAQIAYRAQSSNSMFAVEFGRACFDWAEFATTDRQRETIANEGIAACRQWVAREPKLVGAHYYLGMNLAQLARTKTLGALRIVEEMERIFLTVERLDASFDFAGAARNLGLLYLEVPSFSIGDKKKARACLERAVKLHSDYPENRLNLIEAYLRWGEKNLAEMEIEKLEKMWVKAKGQFSGVRWESSWVDWEKRFQKVKSRAK